MSLLLITGYFKKLLHFNKSKVISSPTQYPHTREVPMKHLKSTIIYLIPKWILHFYFLRLKYNMWAQYQNCN